MAQKHVLTGMRITGQLHLGHYVGALSQWLEVQADGSINCFFLLADVQALTTHADQPELIEKSVREVVLDWIAVGLDPAQANVHFVLQSGVPARFEISQYLMMIATQSEVERNPTVKAEIAALANPTMGFVSYPVDQVADIVMVSPRNVEGNSLLVPVGEDQVPHLEYARVLARRFNQRYDSDVLMACEAQVGEVGRLIGTDGSSKMSKSSGNTINLADPADAVAEKIKRMFTDPSRLRPSDAGSEEGLQTHAPLQYHLAFNPDRQRAEELVSAYLAGGVKDSDIKAELQVVMEDFLAPIRERRIHAEHDTDVVEVIRQGTLEAERYANEVRDAMKEAMFLFRL